MLVNHLRLFIISAVLLFTLSGCQSGDRKEISEVIQNYNQNLPAALVRPNPEVMDPFIGEKEKVHIFTYITRLMTENKVMDSKLLDLKIKDIEFSKSGSKQPIKKLRGSGTAEIAIYAVAHTREKWEYRYLDGKTKKSLGPFKKVDYEGEYLMGKVKDKWVIELLNIVSKEQEKLQDGSKRQ
ncbi:MAG TPA: hypothetical protein VNU93_05145 [Verrucomicrobiae bacterium]|nr:hypothetical protein [Verrucomicrobiae bacterium]